MPPLCGAGRAARNSPRPQLVTVEDLRVVVDPSGFPTFASSAAAPRRSQSEALASQRSWLGDVEQGARFDCGICLTSVPVDDGVVLAACEHSFCRECVLEYARVCVSEARLPVGCPAVGCAQVLSEARLSEIGAPDALLARMRRFEAMKNPLYRECPYCEAPHTAGRSRWSNSLRCDSCRRTFCFVHGGAHPGRPCLVYRARRPRRGGGGGGGGGGGRSSTRGSVGDDTEVVRCPNTACGMRISKASGCNHMTCTSCQTHFCWLCGEKLAEEEITTHYDSASLFGCSGLQFAELKGGTLARMAGRGWVMRLHVWAIRAAMAQTTLLFVVAFVAQLPMLLPFNLLLAAAYATAAAARVRRRPPPRLHRVRVGASVGSPRVLRGGLPRLERAGANDECRATRGRAPDADVRVGRRAAAAAPPAPRRHQRRGLAL